MYSQLAEQQALQHLRVLVLTLSSELLYYGTSAVDRGHPQLCPRVPRLSHFLDCLSLQAEDSHDKLQ